MNRLSFLLVALAAAGCSSIVSDPCSHGYIWDGTSCTTMTAGGEMQPLQDNNGTPPDRIEVLPVDPLVCELPEQKCGTECKLLDSDPLNCGHCGHVCASGICSTSHCVGDLPGHVVAIGHDYASSVPAMDRVIANAVDMGGSTHVRIGWYAGTASTTGAPSAATRGLSQTSRTASATALTGDLSGQLEAIDAIVIEPQTGDGAAAEAAGALAGPALATFLADGHVVVVLETTGGVSYRYANGAGLYSVGAPIDATGSPVTVAAPADEVAQGVVSPYLAKAASVGFAGVAGPVVVDGSGNAVVWHTTW